MQLWNIYHPEMPPFLRETAETDVLMRLRDVGMNCGCEYTSFPLFANVEPYSRFDHSVGVGLIVWHFTGDKTQALAGVLHDVATPAFAHVVDFLHGDYMRQESTEQATAEMICGSKELCGLLKRYRISVAAVENYHDYPLADNDAPKLSADRLEYTLSNGVNFGIISREQAAMYYKDLTVGTNEYGEKELMFQNPETALGFGLTALACGKIYVSDANRYAMQMLAELLQGAIRENVLSEKDLYLQEQTVIAKLKASAFRDEWERYCRYHETVRQKTPGTEAGWRRICAKKRCIDPFIMGMGRTSSVFEEFDKALTAFRESSLEDWICGK